MIQRAYENLSQFKNLSSLSSRMGILMRAIFFDISSPFDNHQQREMSQIHQGQVEKLKVFAKRINELCIGFESFLGHPLDQLPEFDHLMAGRIEPDTNLKGVQCPFQGLSRENTIMWYSRALSDYVQKFQTSISEINRRDLSYIEWQEVMRI